MPAPSSPHRAPAVPLPEAGDLSTPALLARMAADADRCVKCALCLPACPTYTLHRHEADGPRGRIAAAEALAAGRVAPTPRLAAHLDGCLACRACETVCPAGVPYGRLIVDTRTWLARAEPARLAAVRRLGGWLVLPGRRRVLWFLVWLGAALGVRALAQALAPLLPEPLARWLWLWPRLARPGRNPRSVVNDRGTAVRAVEATVATARPTPALCAGCTADGGPETAVLDATRRLAARLGAPLRPSGATPRAGCCGALHRHAGDDTTAASLAAARRLAFGDGDGDGKTPTPALCTVSGCAESLEAGGTRVMDPLPWLRPYLAAARFCPPSASAVPSTSTLASTSASASRVVLALHTPCTQRRRPGPTWEATLAELFPGVAVVPLPTACCGAAGSQLLSHPAQADALAEPLVRATLASGAATLLSANVGCRLHLAARLAAHGWTGTVQHPLEFLESHLAA